MNEPHRFPTEREFEQPEKIVPITHYIRVFRRHAWKIVLFVVFVTSLITIVVFSITPVFESTARVAIDTKISSTVLGQSNAGGTVASEADQIFNTEIQVLQSDAVLRPVAEQFHLQESPSYPNHHGTQAKDAPTTLKNLTVVRVPNSLLIDISYRSPDPAGAAKIANAVAQSYITHGRELKVQNSVDDSAFMERQIDELKSKMEFSARALAGYEDKLGVINPEEKTSMLTARLLQLNTEYTEAENDRIRKESALRALQSGSTAAIDISPQAGDLARLSDILHSDQQKMAKAKSIYGINHPEYKQAANDLLEVTRQYNALREDIGRRIDVDYQEALHREQNLKATLLLAKSQSDHLNASSIEYQQLKRDAEVNTALYNELYRKVKEAGINGSFESSTVHVADLARPMLRPVFPNKLAFIFVGAFFSTLLALLAAIVSDVFDQSLHSIEDIERLTGSEILGVLPDVRDFDSAFLNSGIAVGGNPGSRSFETQWLRSNVFYEECMATLLSSILISNRDRPLHSMLVTSAVHGEGKSSCIARMARGLALQGLRTLVIDADLRCPTQQAKFNLKGKKSFADAIVHGASVKQIAQSVEGYRLLDVITSTPSIDLLHSVGRQIETLLSQCVDNYDMVLIDAPPLFCFAETLQIAGIVDGVLVVGQAARTDQRAISRVLSTLRRLHAHTLGVVLNRTPVESSVASGYGYYSDQYMKGRQLEQPA